MIRVVQITEECEAGTGTGLYDYDRLPVNVKKAVDKALEDEEQMVACDIYQYGLQFLMLYEETNKVDLEVKKGQVAELYGDVTIYHKSKGQL
jgi:hypothetical protein